MLGKRKAQRDLFDVGNVFPVALDPQSFHGQLATAADRLFRDEDFAAFYAERLGRFSTPPSLLALMTLMHHQGDCSDQEAVERTAYDLRWAAVLRRAAGVPLCVKSTFQLFRAHLILHEGVRVVFQQSIAEARRAGLLKGGALRIALDTKPILGRGAVEDTYNLLATGIQQLVRALAALAAQEPEGWAQAHDLGRYFGPSLKGSADLDWSDPEARHQFLAEIVTDARRLLREAGAALAGDAGATVREAAALLAQLLLQDVVETPDGAGGMKAAIKAGTAPERIPSATDPEQRHGRKSKSKRFSGYKASVAVDVESQLILDADVLPGSAGDASEALLQAARAAQATPEGRALLRERVVAEHRLARLGQLGCGQARYRGRQKTRFQLLLLATVANLRWTWNWARRQAPAGTAAGSGAGEPAAGGVPPGAAAAAAAGGERVFDPLGRWDTGASAFLRWLLRPHRLTPALGFGSSNAGFRPRF